MAQRRRVNLPAIQPAGMSSAASANSVTGNGVGSALQLVGDSATPGNSQYYGTNASGAKGYYGLPTFSISANTVAVNSSGQIVSTVNGVESVPTGLPDYFRELTANVPPNGVSDTDKDIWHGLGKIILGSNTTKPDKLSVVAKSAQVIGLENESTGFAAGADQVNVDFRGRYWSGTTAVVSQASIKCVKEAADGSAGTKLAFGTANASNVVATKLELLQTGQLKLNSYTSPTSFTGTAVATLGYDSSGNVIASALAPATTNTTSINATGQLVTTVNGVSSAPLTLNDNWRSVPGGVGPDGVADTTESIRRDGLVGLNVNPLTSLDVGGSFSTAYTNTTAAAYTAAVNDFTVNLGLAGVQTLSSAAASGFTRRIEVWRNATATSKTVPSYSGIDGNTYTTIPAFTSVEVQSDGATWVEIGRSQYGNIGGSIIALLERQSSQTVLTFDGINFRWNGTTDRFEIATAAGSRAVEWVTSTNYGAQSAVINGGAGIDATVQGTPVTLTTTYQVIGDPGILGVENRVYHLWDNSTNKHYRINAVRKGTTTIDGWYSASVELVGVTNATPVTAGQGIQIVGNQIQNANRIAANSPLASALTGTQVDLGQFRFRYTANATNGNLEIQSLTGSTVAFRYYSAERFPATPLYNGAQYSAALSANTTAFVQLPGLGVGTNEIVEWDIITAINHYFVKISNFADTNVNIIVEKAV